jgi:hypothetical protein
MYTIRKSDEGTWWVLDPEGGFVAEFTTKWEAEDFANELNNQS